MNVTNETKTKTRIGVINDYYIGRYGNHELVFTATIKYEDEKEAYVVKVLEFARFGEFIYQLLKMLNVANMDNVVGSAVSFTVDGNSAVHTLSPFTSRKTFNLNNYFNESDEGLTISVQN